MARAKAERNTDRQESEAARRAERVEWVIGWISAFLVLALIGLMAYEAVTNADGTPELSAEAGPARMSGEGFVLPVEVVNSGSATASDVVVEGTLVREGEDAETSSVTLDYVAGESAVEASLTFSGDPSQAEVQVRVKGYTRP